MIQFWTVLNVVWSSVGTSDFALDGLRKMAVSTLTDRYSWHSDASFPGEPGKGGLQGGAQELAALSRVWVFCCRKLKCMLIPYPGVQLACGQGYLLRCWGWDDASKILGSKILQDQPNSLTRLKNNIWGLSLNICHPKN